MKTKLIQSKELLIEYLEEKITKEKIVSQIQKLVKDDEPINRLNIHKKIGKVFYDKLISTFGNLEHAVTAAGLDYSKIRLRGSQWPKNNILKTIKELHSKGKPLNHRYAWNNYGGLAHAARNKFGSWEKAITFAGLDYNDIRVTKAWSKEKIIDAIKECVHKGYNPLCASNPASAGIRAIAVAHFGNWQKSLQASGFDKKYFNNKIIEELVLEIQKLYKGGKPLNSGSIQEQNQPLYKRALRYFGNWENAITAAGFDYSEIRLRKTKSRQ
ncbi:MAG: hypothetical protein KAR07_01790 [Spirochaetes bacterium]|nr:hypothetical protein [Spirochaetota bacterium]